MANQRVIQRHQALYHGDIYVAFVPDEEVGLFGSKHIDFSRFPVDFAYTIDCCELCLLYTSDVYKRQLYA